MVRDRAIIVIGAVLACVLQLTLAPHIAIAGGVPNFIVAYVLAVSVARPQTSGSVLPFTLGLFYDIATGSVIGPMAFTLTLVAAIASFACEALGNDTLFIPIASLVVCALLAELGYTVFMMVLGYGASAADMLLYRTLPCFIYDLVLALLLFFVMQRIVPEESASSQPGIARLV